MVSVEQTVYILKEGTTYSLKTAALYQLMQGGGGGGVLRVTNSSAKAQIMQMCYHESELSGILELAPHHQTFRVFPGGVVITLE